MLARLNHTQMLRYAGLFTWAAVGLWLAIFLFDQTSPLYEAPNNAVVALRVARWMAAFTAFGVVYWRITQGVGQRSPRPVDHFMLLVLTLCAIGVSYFSGTALGSILLMVIAGLLPWLLSPRVGIAWLVVGNLTVLPVYIEPLGFPVVVACLQALGYMGFSSFVFVTALVARQQVEAREEQRRLNAELRATRALLGESVRVNERTRISRELHDLLGHHLTALSLNLEVAGHLAPEGRAREHVQQAHTLAKLLLTDVREAVSQLREGGAIDLALALRPLSENVPALDIHMDIEAPLTLDDPERAHVLLRCTQEIITNTVRHANAHNLWINARREGNTIIVDARDDGRGADALVAGNGLRGMRERLQQHGGDLRIETQTRPHPQAGFRLRLTLPASATLAASEGAIA